MSLAHRLPARRNMLPAKLHTYTGPGFQPSRKELRLPAEPPSIKISLQGSTPLMKAAGTGQGNIVKFLIEQRADAGEFDDLDRGILYFARHNTGSFNLLPWLEEYGRDTHGRRLEYRVPKPDPAKYKYKKNQNFAKQYRIGVRKMDFRFQMERHSRRMKQLRSQRQNSAFQPNEAIQIPKP